MARAKTHKISLTNIATLCYPQTKSSFLIWTEIIDLSATIFWIETNVSAQIDSGFP